MKLQTTFFCVILFCGKALSQGVSTAKDQSPIIIGTNAKINYVKQQVLSQKVPDELTPYLAGLLFSNSRIGSHKSAINEALMVWFKKYNSLKASLEKHPDLQVKKLALKKLNEGDFTGVESLIKVKTNYDALVKMFPKSYQTNGNSSPIIVGDFGSVSYVVKEIITYQLPEGLTINLLNELRSKDKILGFQNAKLGDLKNNLESRDAIIKDYIKRYNFIREQLKKSPLEVYKKAYAFFNRGDLEGALRVLDSGSSNDKSYGESRMLKARILLLQLNTNALDATLTEIDKSFSIGVSLAPTADNYFEYSRFLIDYLSNYMGAISFLEKAESLTEDKLEKIQIYNYLGMAYYSTDRVKSNETHEKAIALLDNLEPLKSPTLIVLKAQLFFNIAYGYSTRFFDVGIINTAISYSKKAIVQMEKLEVFSKQDLYKRAMMYNQSGQLYAMIADSVNSIIAYSKALSILEGAYLNDQQMYAIGLVTVYYNIAELYFNTGRAVQAIEILKKSLAILEPKISLNSRVYIIAYEQVYTALFKNYMALNMVPDIISGLYALKAKVKPFVLADPKIFLVHQAWTDTDLGSIYVAQKQLDSARKYLKPAYDYYLNNVNMVQYDKAKFSTCLIQMNELMLQSGEAESAIEGNRKLLGKFKAIAYINRMAYDELIPQMERQLARVYTFIGIRDSAFYHIKLALDLLEPKVKQYGTLYLMSYGDCMLQSFLMNLHFRDFSGADSVVSKFNSDCKVIMEVDPFVKSNMQASIGERLTSFAVNLFGFTQAPETGILSALDLELLFGMDAKYFELADEYFVVAVRNNPLDGIKHALSLSSAMYLQNFLIPRTSNMQDRAAYVKKKCEIANRAKLVLSKLPVNPYIESIRQKVIAMSTDCN
ncbi:tetratricopeptide repeat protein [Pedobacter gandavensis]|uniref:Tetratricopeptide repeat protein n=1 Tax=Pedobacter gandavensis TaxID=2679963 RepID=A0ABR6EUZ2_9SPHI|nr:tetratricopeptide repeat protein [Pedobacter gandavensis]MBB2148273.1 hypothetical protein [Pedobacter gandavensis]